MGYVLDVLAGALRLMKAPLSLLVYIFLLTMMCTGLYLGLRRPAMRVICEIPGAGWLTICEGFAQAQVIEPNATMRADFPGLMALQNDALDRLLAQSSAGSQLAFDVKRAEVLVRGLTSYINHSALENKVLIASLLSQFVGDAKDTGRDLQKLSSKLYSAVASVTAFTDYAGSTISAARASQAKDASPVVQRMFQASMDVLSEQITRTLKHATKSMERLDRLEESMATIHDVLVKEDLLVSERRNRLAADLWTRLGWNAEEMRVDDTQLKLLGSVQDYRVQALNHVIGTMQTLDAIDADLAELQSQLSAPAVAKLIPVEVQLASIQDSVRRLRQRMEATTRGVNDGSGTDLRMRDTMLGSSAEERIRLVDEDW
ncbi:hypothetical protein LXA43DRAFT_905541 [Ganoderma leucocontextum]|nr:hypothetical protein LXA43DRAFT_905541 [Ganoderma leucocontextum]